MTPEQWEAICARAAQGEVVYQDQIDRFHLIAYVKELKAAAGKVACAQCERMGHAPDEPCTACADIWAVIDKAEGRK